MNSFIVAFLVAMVVLCVDARGRGGRGGHGRYDRGYGGYDRGYGGYGYDGGFAGYFPYGGFSPYGYGYGYGGYGGFAYGGYGGYGGFGNQVDNNKKIDINIDVETEEPTPTPPTPPTPPPTTPKPSTKYETPGTQCAEWGIFSCSDCRNLMQCGESMVWEVLGCPAGTYCNNGACTYDVPSDCR